MEANIDFDKTISAQYAIIWIFFFREYIQYFKNILHFFKSLLIINLVFCKFVKNILFWRFGT